MLSHGLERQPEKGPDAAQSSALRGTTAPKGAVCHAKSSFPWIDGPKRGQSPRNSVLCYAGLPLPEMPDGILAEVKVEKPRESQRPARRARDFSSLHDHGGVSFPVGASLGWTVSSFA